MVALAGDQGYQPTPGPNAQDPTLLEVVQWAQRELEKIGLRFSEFSLLQHNVLHVEPTRPREGMVVVADGSDWDPGEGAGQYTYIGGNWVLSSSGPPIPRIHLSPLGYGPAGQGIGGFVTQATSKATSVTINTICGRIETFNDALAGGAHISFEVANSSITSAADCVVLHHGTSSNSAHYAVTARRVTSSGFGVLIQNLDTVSHSDAIVINFAIIKSVDD